MGDLLSFTKDSKKGADVARPSLVQLLNRQLADTIDLRSQTRHAEFNLSGAYVQELSATFDGLARDLRRFADLIAERVSSLGGHPLATVRLVTQASNLLEYPGDASLTHDHLRALLSGYSRYERDTLQNMKAAQQIGDCETVELLRTIAASVEKNLWFLEACLEGLVLGFAGGKLPAWSSAFDRAPFINQPSRFS